jgi:Zn-dependent protease with chaperone function
MISNPLYLLSMLSSPLLAFSTIALATEMALRIFSIQGHRIRSTLRLLPFLGLLVDVLFSKYSIAYWINPLSCASCVQNFFLTLFFPELKAYLTENQISLINYLGNTNEHSFFSAIFILFAFTSLFFFVRKLLQLFYYAYFLQIIIKKGDPCDRMIQSERLESTLQRHNVKIYTSDLIEIPFALHSNVIVMPRNIIDILSQEEFEAVIAHEWEHIKFRDTFVRPAYHLLSALFWWVPTSSWIKKLELEQEMACDQNVMKYDFRLDTIASALMKVVRRVKKTQSICCFNDGFSPTLYRLRALIGPGPGSCKGIDRHRFGPDLLIASAGALLLFFCWTGF